MVKDSTGHSAVASGGGGSDARTRSTQTRHARARARQNGLARCRTGIPRICRRSSGVYASFFFRCGEISSSGAVPLSTDALRHLHLFDILAGREVEHHVGQQLLEDRAEAAGAGAALERLAGDRAQRAVLEGQLHLFELEELGVLLRERVLRLLEDAHERILVERLERHGDRQDGRRARG